MVQIAAGSNHVLALTHKAELYGWGANNYNQLTSDKEPSIYTPKLIPIPGQEGQERVGKRTKIVTIFAAKNHSLFITKKGELYMWGAVWPKNRRLRCRRLRPT